MLAVLVSRIPAQSSTSELQVSILQPRMEAMLELQWGIVPSLRAIVDSFMPDVPGMAFGLNPYVFLFGGLVDPYVPNSAAVRIDFGVVIREEESPGISSRIHAMLQLFGSLKRPLTVFQDKCVRHDRSVG